jgi:signal transduction histidine kinase/CheY-like chemotaxis protein
MADRDRRRSGRTNAIARKLLARLVVAGLLIMLLSAVVSIGVSYREQRLRLEGVLGRIEGSELRPITESLWVYDVRMLQTQLEGLAREPELAYLAVYDHDGLVASSGGRVPGRMPQRELELRYEYDGELRDLGRLSVYADTAYLRRYAFRAGLLGSIYPILAIIAAGTFLYIAFHRLVVTRVLDITHYLRTFNTDFERRSLVFESAPPNTGRYDELDEVATAINSLRNSLNARHAQLLEAHRRAELEVEEKTRELTRKVQDLEETRAELTEANEAKTRFLANMSHEVRTPITGVIGLAGVLGRSDLDESQRAYARAIEDSGRSLLGIVDDLLDFSKLEDGRIELAEEEIDLRELLQGAVQLVTHTDRGHRVPVDIEYGEDLPARVRGDRVRLQQVLVNLLSNAVKFTRDGRIVARVERNDGADGAAVRTHWHPARVRFTVADTGVGIPKELLPRVFESFYQADSSYAKRFDGTGLGLAISRELVELMGGTIDAESEVGRGSTFRVDVPLPVVDEAVAPSPEAGRAPAEGTPRAAGPMPGGRLRILVAEDNAINRMYLERFLADEGHEVSTAADGTAALEAVAGSPFDLILMDIQMPGLDGIETTRRLREHTDIPIIALTAYAREEEVRSFLEAGMNAAVTKPVAEQELRRAIREVTAGYRPDR